MSSTLSAGLSFAVILLGARDRSRDGQRGREQPCTATEALEELIKVDLVGAQQYRDVLLSTRSMFQA